MSRTAKQFGYGVLYLVLIALVVVSMLPRTGQEEGIVAPLPTSVRPLEVRGTVTVMTAADGSVAFLGRVENPNEAHAASSFPYSFRIMRGETIVSETSRRTGFAYPKESTTLLEVVPAASFFEDTNVVLVLGAPTWTSTEFLVRPTLAAVRAETSSDEFGAFTEGEVRNTGVVSVTTARIIALIKDANGFPLFAAQTLVENIPGGASRSFFIRFPRDRGIFERAAPDGTELIVEVQ